MDDTPRPTPDTGPGDELKSWIVQLDRLVGMPSGREMARLAGLSGTRLPASTLSDLRRRRGIPREPVCGSVSAGISRPTSS
ncbi:hypothetical protein EV192_10123 [Actinocrispum wychmicini]|uniref:Uncharacterized protein n=1 Tax=Actinocrispum wychmicini TaxID=1213861 RepID=A0A4R2K3C4_9PSEU|nr:hypothetical protein [Actinocrispum wychmicini]TCO64259.1 hypothetical protein EV192_10123 [Actinocrispum wychmicini]